ncbi:MAG TPA: hypothetical protein VGM84_10670 [Steroidobacteraceae bacterium]
MDDPIESTSLEDRFLSSGWRRPRADFEQRVRKRLEELERRPRGVFRFMRPEMARAASVATAAVLVVGALAFPPVRAAATAFLDMFRVVNFAPVSFDPARLSGALGKDLDLPKMFAKQVTVIEQPSPPQPESSLAAAGAAAGVRVQTPTWLPVGMEQQSIEVGGGSSARVTLSVAMIKQVLDSFAIDDLTVPEQIDGQSATVRIPNVVKIAYSDSKRHVFLLQARQPGATFPAGADLSQLAEVGLRVLGIESAEAHRFAQSFDWRTTLILPIPSDVATFRQIDVQGNPGVLIERAVRVGTVRLPPIESRVLWASGGAVYALMGDIRSAELFEMAQSMQFAAAASQ